ncbi:MAG: glycoside hydrolase family 18 protein [Vagococcus salmoninarum]|uniref:glycoside hydrolase family 18 protein n=1 Tax=Vagococcus salmoninarum TaxID=2739 RepID=UPI003F9A1E45
MRRKSRSVIVLFITTFMYLVFFSFPQVSQGEEVLFRTVGYLPDYDTMFIERTINFKELTDVNYFSLIPQEDGSLKFTDSGAPSQLELLVKEGHQHQVRVGVSIGGWGLSDYFIKATNKETLPIFIKNIKDFAIKYDLDTIDIDWEYPAEDKALQFETFIKALKAELGDEILLSICVPTGVASNGLATGRWEKHFTSAALNSADWVNIMAYDAQIEGFPNHSPSDLQKNNLNYWNEVMGGKHLHKLVAGVPFYAKAEDGSVMTYRKVIEEYAGVPTTEVVYLNDKDYYINNKEVIQKKVQDTIDLGGLGVMIWAPTQDAELNNSNRLMTVVTDTVKKNQLKLDRGLVVAPALSIGTKEVSKTVLVITGVSGLVISLGLVIGKFKFLVPKKINGKRVNQKQLGKLIGTLLALVASLFLLFLLLPLKLVIAIILVLGLLVYFLLK